MMLTRLWISIVKAVAVFLLFFVFVFVIWFEVGFAGKLLSDYRDSIVRDTVAAMKERP